MASMYIIWLMIMLLCSNNNIGDNNKHPRIMLYFFISQLCLISVVIVSSWALPDMGPADIKLKYTEKCKGFRSSLVNFNISLYTIHDRKIIFNFNGTYGFPLSDDCGITINAAVKRNGGWRPNFLNIKLHRGDCNILKNGMPKTFASIAKQVGAPKPYSCPLPPGTVQLNVEGDVADINRIQRAFNLDHLPYGDFKAQINFTRFGTVYGCIISYVEIVPKNNKRLRNG